MEAFFKKGIARSIDGEDTPEEVWQSVTRAFGSKFERISSSQPEENNSQSPEQETAEKQKQLEKEKIEKEKKKKKKKKKRKRRKRKGCQGKKETS